MHAIPAINLAKKRGNFFDSFINWALTIGRVVIILTEGIAMVAFLYRFSLDSRLVDLHDTVKNLDSVVASASFKEQERTYRSLQNRLALIKQTANTTTETAQQATKLFTDIIGLIPTNVILVSLALSDESIKFSLDTQSVLSLASFTQALRSYPRIASVSIDSIQNKTQTGTISVNITAMLKH